MTEAPYPMRGGRKGRIDHLPAAMPGVRVPLLRPYGGLTYEEWIAAPLRPSEFQDTRPKGDAESVGKKIQKFCSDADCDAASAADAILGNR